MPIKVTSIVFSKKPTYISSAPKNQLWFAMQFAFGIPVKSKIVSKNWDVVKETLSRSLTSILAQEYTDIKVFLACHEIPDVPEIKDPRVQVLQATFDVPLYKAEFMLDKHRKREMIAVRWRGLGGGYLMYVDSDDLVSNRLAKFVMDQHTCRGFVVQNGYDLNHSTGKMNIAPRFYKICGTNCVINWAIDELPNTLFQRQHVLFRDTITVGSAFTPSLFAKRGEPLRKIPFPAVVYVRSHGENATDFLDTESWRRRLLRSLTPTIRDKSGILTEFAM